MKLPLALVLAGMTTLATGLAGCGAAPRAVAPAQKGLFGARMAATTIVDVPGVPVGVAQKVSGKYKIYKLTGTGTVNALDEARLDVGAKLAAKVGPINVTKVVTFGITRRDDAAWPYQFDVANLTDKEKFSNKAQIVSAANGQTTFKLDDNTTALIAADGQGSVRVVTGDFDLTFGKAARTIGPAIADPPSAVDLFSR